MTNLQKITGQQQVSGNNGKKKIIDPRAVNRSLENNLKLTNGLMILGGVAAAGGLAMRLFLPQDIDSIWGIIEKIEEYALMGTGVLGTVAGYVYHKITQANMEKFHSMPQYIEWFHKYHFGGD